MSAKQAINDKLQGSVATYLRHGGVVNNQVKKGLLLSLRVKNFFKSVNIWQSYRLERGCLVHFVRLANTQLKDGESLRRYDRGQTNTHTHTHTRLVTILGSPIGAEQLPTRTDDVWLSCLICNPRSWMAICNALSVRDGTRVLRYQTTDCNAMQRPSACSGPHRCAAVSHLVLNIVQRSTTNFSRPSHACMCGR